MPGKITDQHIENAVRSRHEFITAGAIHAYRPTQTGQFSISFGSLPEEWRKRYVLDVRSAGIDYIVMSFATPVAWVTGHGVKVVPRVNYSRTTSRLQNRVRAAFDGDYVETPE